MPTVHILDLIRVACKSLERSGFSEGAQVDLEALEKLLIRD